MLLSDPLDKESGHSLAFAGDSSVFATTGSRQAIQTSIAEDAEIYFNTTDPSGNISRTETRHCARSNAAIFSLLQVINFVFQRSFPVGNAGAVACPAKLVSNW